MSRTLFLAPFSLALALAAAMPATGRAQSNAPLTGAMSGGGVAQATPVPATASTAAPAAAAQMPARPVVQQVQTPMPQAAPQAAPAEPAPEAFGDITRGLLAAQADGRRAGAALPVLGAVSTAAWNRYVNSFTRPIPEWFTKRVETENTN
ncbi:DUF3613 domain-containing protein [Achromobacter xylosoxidans]|uniref:DUF3613 domain-containing protein n=1 Tax=Alcaligenes xylosoxydans xylosoxydans TaxID=85698 RepID=UPI0006C733C8|nr:DUF3613 domain-containing protein [Achromobacter xylosoxidans]CUJ70662.1 Protein of uncharacterised function (DUF3613) [Achromobacter xylosoxidans]